MKEWLRDEVINKTSAGRLPRPGGQEESGRTEANKGEGMPRGEKKKAKQC